MKIQLNTAILAIVVSSIMAGCSDSTQPFQETNASIAQRKSHVKGQTQSDEALKTSADFDTLPEQAVLISVNGKVLTKNTFLKWVNLRKKLIGASLPSQMIGSDPTAIIKEQMLSTVTNDYALQTVASDYAKDMRIEVTTNHIERCRRGFLQTAKLQGMSWGNALKRFNSEEQETINERVSAEAMVAAVQMRFLEENKPEVSEDEINALYEKYMAYNKTCTISNDVTWAKASNIWNRIISGESFEDLAIQFDEDEYREADGIWGEFHISDFTDEPEIWKLASKFRPGYVSPPIEADNGITILKINSIEDEGHDVNAFDYTPAPSAEINISRIFIHLPLFIEEVNKEQFAKECQMAKKIAEFNKFINGLISKADINYPCGIEIFGAGDTVTQSSFIGQ